MFLLLFLLKQVDSEIQNRTLITALCEILQQCNQQKYHIVHLTSDFNSVLNGDNSENNFLNVVQENVVDPVQFHACLRIKVVPNIGDVEKYYYENAQALRDPYGILLFLYSVIATRVCFCKKKSQWCVDYFVYCRVWNKCVRNRTLQTH